MHLRNLLLSIYYTKYPTEAMLGDILVSIYIKSIDACLQKVEVQPNGDNRSLKSEISPLNYVNLDILQATVLKPKYTDG